MHHPHQPIWWPLALRSVNHWRLPATTHHWALERNDVTLSPKPQGRSHINHRNIYSMMSRFIISLQCNIQHFNMVRFVPTNLPACLGNSNSNSHSDLKPFWGRLVRVLKMFGAWNTHPSTIPLMHISNIFSYSCASNREKPWAEQVEISKALMSYIIVHYSI